jgi:hypothetical protein
LLLIVATKQFARKSSQSRRDEMFIDNAPQK